MDAKTPKTTKLSEKQLAKLGEANQQVAEANREFQKARGNLNSLVELVLDAHEAPASAQIDLQNGTVVWPDSPVKLAGDIDQNGVSGALAETPSTPPAA